MVHYSPVTSALLWLMGFCNPWNVQAADFLETLTDLTLGAHMLEDLAGSVAAATELPSISDLGEALRQAVGFDPEQLQHLTQEQRQHIDLAQSFFLSPFGLSLDDGGRPVPRFAANHLTSADSVSSRTTTTAASSGGSSISKLPFSLRGVYGLDTSELERLAETIAEGVANSTSVGLRTMNPLALAAAAAAAARKAASLATTPSVEKREDGAASSGSSSPPGSAAAAAVANLVDPLGLLNLQQRAALQKRQLELQAELQKTLLDLKNEKQLKEQLERQQQQLEEQQQQLEEQQQQLQQQQLRQQLQHQLLLEQQKEQQLLAKSKEAGFKGAAASSDRNFFGVRLGSDEEGAALATAAESSKGADFETAGAATPAAGAAAPPAATAAAPAASPSPSSGEGEKTSGAATGGGLDGQGGFTASITSAEAEATALTIASPPEGPEDEEEEEEKGEEDVERSPQRFWSRTNPLGPLQPASDMLYLLKWSLINPLAILEWKKYSFAQCMDIYNDADICANYLKVEPNALNHGGLNSPWVSNTGD